MEPGLYNENNELKMDWNELIKKSYIKVDKDCLTNAASFIKDKLIIPNYIQNIKQESFWYCVQIKEIILPENIEKLDFSTFSYCRSLQKIDIPNNVMILGKKSFNSCLSLKQVSLPQKLKEIETSVFNNCQKLEKIIYPGSRQQFKQIKGWQNIFEGTNLTIENIEFHKTLEELIEEGKSFREANIIIKQQETLLY